MARGLPLPARLVAVTVMLCAAEVDAQTATQTVHFRVVGVSQIAVSGNPGPMAINTADAGSGPTTATSTGTSYAVTTNESNQKISASIDRPMPVGVSLEVRLAAPAGAISAGSVALGTAGADVVTGISAAAATSLPIEYRLSATPSAQLGATSRTVTFTIVAGT